ncbi:hypothetical protein BVH03_22670 [Pseudomonas sp. PA15(2017)]|uniref:hypothetical protein n=1 Tax=Pseudomonas sp. PA15(2017) TaxID=1932111 RepID=UPI0009638C00|nr:hypothetical protein [Pseudomonas sp. PA15(2017)]OLU23044.1 hypothetical protein BVH03_22670 [Pseudomonas sp. PA15(2017)]
MDIKETHATINYLDNLEKKLNSDSLLLGRIKGVVGDDPVVLVPGPWNNKTKTIDLNKVFNNAESVEGVKALIKHYHLSPSADNSVYDEVSTVVLNALLQKASEIEALSQQAGKLKNYLATTSTSQPSAAEIKSIQAIVSAVSTAKSESLAMLKVSEGRDAQVAIRDASNINAALTEIVATNKNVYKDFLNEKVLLPVTYAHQASVDNTSKFRDFTASELIKSIHLDIRQKLNAEAGSVSSKLDSALKRWLSDTEQKYGNKAFDDFNKKTLDHLQSNGHSISAAEKEQVTLANQTIWFHTLFNDRLNNLGDVINSNHIYQDVLANELKYASAYKFSAALAKSITTLSTLPNSIAAAIEDSSASNVISAVKYASDALNFARGQQMDMFLSKKEQGVYFAKLKEDAINFKSQLDAGVLDIKAPIKSALTNEKRYDVNLASELSPKLRNFYYSELANKEAWHLGNGKDALIKLGKNPFAFTSDILAISKDIYGLSTKTDDYSTVLNSLTLAADVSFLAGDALGLIEGGGKFIAPVAKGLNAVGSVIFVGLSVADIVQVANKYGGDYSSRQSQYDLGGAIVNMTASVAAVAASVAFPPAALALLVIPDFHSIGVALDLQDEIDRQRSLGHESTAQVLEVAHTNAALDSTPLINWFSSIYRNNFTGKIDALQNSQAWQDNHVKEIIRDMDRDVRPKLIAMKNQAGLDQVEFVALSNHSFSNLLSSAQDQEKFGNFYLARYSSSGEPSYQKAHDGSNPNWAAIQYSGDYFHKKNVLVLIDIPPLAEIKHPAGELLSGRLDIYSRNLTEDSNTTLIINKAAKEISPYNAMFDLYLQHHGSHNATVTYKFDVDYLIHSDKIHLLTAGYSDGGPLQVLDFSGADLHNPELPDDHTMDFPSTDLKDFDIVKGPVVFDSRWEDSFWVNLEEFNGTYVSYGHSNLFLRNSNATVYSGLHDEVTFEGSDGTVFLKDMPKSISGSEPSAGSTVSASPLTREVAFVDGTLAYKGSANTVTANGFANFVGTHFDDKIVIDGKQGIQTISTGGGHDQIHLKNYTSNQNVSVFSSSGSFSASLNDVSNASLYMGGTKDHDAVALIDGYSPFTTIVSSAEKSTVKNTPLAQSYSQSIGFQGDAEKSLDYYSGLGGATFYIDNNVTLNYLDNAKRTFDTKFIVDDLSNYSLSTTFVDLGAAKNDYIKGSMKTSNFLEYLGGNGKTTDQLVVNYSLADVKHGSTINIFSNSVAEAPLVLADGLGHAIQIGLAASGGDYYLS